MWLSGYLPKEAIKLSPLFLRYYVCSINFGMVLCTTIRLSEIKRRSVWRSCVTTTGFVGGRSRCYHVTPANRNSPTSDEGYASRLCKHIGLHSPPSASDFVRAGCEEEDEVEESKHNTTASMFSYALSLRMLCCYGAWISTIGLLPNALCAHNPPPHKLVVPCGLSSETTGEYVAGTTTSNWISRVLCESSKKRQKKINW